MRETSILERQSLYHVMSANMLLPDTMHFPAQAWFAQEKAEALLAGGVRGHRWDKQRSWKVGQKIGNKKAYRKTGPINSINCMSTWLGTKLTRHSETQEGQAGKEAAVSTKDRARLPRSW